MEKTIDHGAVNQQIPTGTLCIFSIARWPGCETLALNYRTGSGSDLADAVPLN